MITTVLPASSAGAIFHTASISGKFQGVIAATTPSGRRWISMRRCASSWIVSTGICSDAVYWNQIAAPNTSCIALSTGLPCSWDKSGASSLPRAWIAAPMSSSAWRRRASSLLHER